MRNVARILFAVTALLAPASADAQEYRMPPPLPGPYSYGFAGCRGGYISVVGDVCEPYFPLMRTWPRTISAYGRARHKTGALRQAPRHR